MAKRIAQVDIKINGINSISQMEDELTKLNEEIKKLPVGSEAFKTMSNEIAGLQDKLKSTNSQLEGVTSTEKAEGLLKLGEGFAGALIGVQGLSMALGGTSEEMDKVIQKVGGLILAMDGLRRVTEAFSAENIKRLKGLGRSWQTLQATVQAFSLATKAALLATGIGALVVAVGLLIANWERLTALISNSARQRQLNKEVKELEKIIKAQDEILAGTEAEAAARKELVEYNQDYAKAAQLAFKAQAQKLVFLQDELNLNAKLIEKKLMDLESMREGSKRYKQAVLDLKVMYENQAKMTAEYELQAAILNKVGGELNNISKITANDEAIRRLQNVTKLLGGQEFTQRKQYELAYQNLELEKKGIELRKQSDGKLTKSAQERLDAINAEQQALAGAEKIRIKNLNLAIAELTRGKEYEASQKSVTNDLEANKVVLEKMLQEYDKLTVLNEANLATTEKRLEVDRYILQQHAEMYPFDKKGLEILEASYGLQYKRREEITRIGDIEMDVTKLSLETKLNYLAQWEANKLLFTEKTRLLEIEKEAVQKNIDALDAQRKLVILNGDLAFLNKQKLENEKAGYDLNAKNAKSLEEEYYWRQKSEKVAGEILAMEDTMLAANNEILTITNDIASQKITILQIDGDINALNQENLDVTKQITYELEQQMRFSERAKTFLEQYGEEIQASLDVMNAGFEFAMALQDRVAKKAQERIKKADKELDRLNKKQEKATDLLKELQDELKDADGERYNNLLDMIKQVQDAQIENGKTTEQLIKDETNAKLRAQYLIDIAEWKNARTAKVQALINATIQGALAVVKALPNVVLAALTGVLSAAAIATIAVQPVPAKPAEPEYLAKGGYLTGKSHAEGGEIIEAEGGEFIINKKATQRYYPVLEAINESGNRKFATGGITAPISTQTSTDLIDYDKLAQAILSGIQPKVAVVDIVTGINKVKLIQANATL